MSTKHTPGPWRPTSIGTTFSIDAVGANYSGIAFVNPLGMHDKGIPSPMDKANARLIAASPRLLKALADLASYANGKLGRNPYLIDEYKEALQAIAEAIGYTGDWMDTLNEVKQ